MRARRGSEFWEQQRKGLLLMGARSSLQLWMRSGDSNSKSFANGSLQWFTASDEAWEQQPKKTLLMGAGNRLQLQMKSGNSTREALPTGACNILQAQMSR